MSNKISHRTKKYTINCKVLSEKEPGIEKEMMIISSSHQELAFSKVDLESTRHMTEVPHPAGSGGPSADGLDTPVICGPSADGLDTPVF